MGALSELFANLAPTPEHRPWPRVLGDKLAWHAASEALARHDLTLLGLWGEAQGVHMALADAAQIGVISLICPDGRFPSVGAKHPPAIRLERAIGDLQGFEAIGAPDTRPWLDHGRWLRPAPMGRSSAEPAHRDYAFLPVDGEGLHQIPVGPVHAGIIEPGHFRFTANGETIVRLEQRLGYAHKGVESLLAGASLEEGARIAGRVSGDSTVAYAWAFAQAVEAATGCTPPARALWLRALMAELERLANHFGDIGAICNDAAFAIMHAHCSVLRERVLRAADACFGHRLMRDCIAPGGVTANINPAGASKLRRDLKDWRKRFKGLVELYDETPSLQDRTAGAGFLKPELAARFGAGGFVGRASGRSFDARKAFAYAPYDRLDFEVPVFHQGDVDARVWVRIREAEQSLSLIEQILDGLPAGPTRVEAPAAPGEGLALVEGFRGDVLVWVRVTAERIVARCHLRDPSWFQWPLLEVAVEGNIVGDFPLCNKSFNCSYSGHDL